VLAFFAAADYFSITILLVAGYNWLASFLDDKPAPIADPNNRRRCFRCPSELARLVWCLCLFLHSFGSSFLP
jgi:hypothetical protein